MADLNNVAIDEKIDWSKIEVKPELISRAKKLEGVNEQKLALKISNIDAFYGKIQALRRVSFGVPEGSIVSLLGANGAGKTTTLRVISGLVHAAAGKIEFFDEDITNLSPEKITRKGIIQVPEGRQVFPELTVEENLKIGSYSIKQSNAERSKSLDMIYTFFPKLKQRRAQVAATLSGGEQQMLAIGRGLMGKPRVLLLDEPSLGLAPIIVKEIFEIIKMLNRETGTTILLVEQNATKALKISHFGFVLETGRVTIGDKAEVLLNNEDIKKAYLGGGH
ncbi:MAG TPA: ABC transporter ATP-binding protein [Spirochaetota bacterium]|nr:ABC transporter ATP-binding protein [Spirochaetota bacterium]HOM38004.1 ABC transporter ATP-binding protein [Spirochaetota bacterium]HPQ48808.1 ABC transporter ATP-binding protein [Spirochaetota bacterium]